VVVTAPVLGVRLTVSEYNRSIRATSRLRAGSYSRRGFLGALVGCAALLGGCGAEQAGKAPPADSEVLDGLLRRELAAGAAVIGVAGSDLIARQDVLHARRLVALAGVAGVPPAPTSAADLRTALARKQAAVFAYVQALPRLADPDLRVAVMQLAASEAEHLAALRLAAGEEPVPDPFAGFTQGTAR
jgi:hypothetical protein